MITDFAPCALSFGMTLFLSRDFISRGTPGRTKMVLLWCLTANPEAVPDGLGMSSAPRGMSAWMALDSEGVRPSSAKKAWRFLSASVFVMSGTPQNSATVCRVMSSGVGPMPPVMMMVSARSDAPARAARMSFLRSPIAVWRVTSRPRQVSWPEMYAALVSAMRPAINSLPMDISSTFIGRDPVAIRG